MNNQKRVTPILSRYFEFEPSTFESDPIVLYHDGCGAPPISMTIQELEKSSASTASKELSRIKLYRSAIENYGKGNLEHAEFLLKRLIQTSDKFKFEYFERLANLHHMQSDYDKETHLLEEALARLHKEGGSRYYVRLIEKRLEKLLYK